MKKRDEQEKVIIKHTKERARQLKYNKTHLISQRIEERERKGSTWYRGYMIDVTGLLGLSAGICCKAAANTERWARHVAKMRISGNYAAHGERARQAQHDRSLAKATRARPRLRQKPLRRLPLITVIDLTDNWANSLVADGCLLQNLSLSLSPTREMLASGFPVGR